MEPLKTNWESIGLSNDFLFGKIMRKPALCKRMLEIILGIKIDRIEYLESQKSIDEEWDARSIRLDIYVQDNKDIAYNFDHGADVSIPKRIVDTPEFIKQAVCRCQCKHTACFLLY